jgi:cell fate regulator YaaT (PSP1 superfamily)
MAKNQGLPLAPSEISGLCGRLLCCLAYEDNFYSERKKVLPKVNSQVKTKEGLSGTIRGLNVIKDSVLLETDEGQSYVEVPVADLETTEAPADTKPQPSND